MNATKAKMVAELRLELDEHGVKVERIGLQCCKTLVCAAASSEGSFCCRCFSDYLLLLAKGNACNVHGRSWCMRLTESTSQTSVDRFLIR
eukprot:6208701-Pleurochrysis_carterae.AAC.1